MKYNGEYYLTGNWLGGRMYRSTNLTDWGDLTKVFSIQGASWTNGVGDEQIHASDPNYENGVFHLYFQVYNGSEQNIGHATATEPTGTYTQPIDAALDQHIDAELFKDIDGSFYFYTVKFTGGNQIWGQPMDDPWTLSGSPQFLLAVRPNTWEDLDPVPINEAPVVFHYRNLYYMLSNCNSTGDLHYGNYAFSCATADGPLAFSNDGKYPDPVMDSATHPGGRISNVGQPWVAPGLNGFEHWVGYFAIYTADGLGPRYQAIDQMHFFGQFLYIDGPTRHTTPGYHPRPAEPQYRDLFNDLHEEVGADWAISGGAWTTIGGAFLQTDVEAGSARALLDRTPATHYLFETNLKFPGPGGSHAIVWPFYQDADNHVAVVIDRPTGQWGFLVEHDGNLSESYATLPTGFRYDAYHHVRVTKNAGRFNIQLDGVPAPGPSAFFDTPFTGTGRPALGTASAAAAFDGVVYTIGWDEWGDAIRGWGDGMSELATTGSWSGTVQSGESGMSQIFKGDRMDRYEVSVQALPTMTPPADGQPHTVGLYAVAIDADNHLSAEVDVADRTLTVAGVKNGAAITPQTATIPSRRPVPTSEGTGRVWRYTFDDPGSGWEAPSFDDTGWTSGEGGIGRGDHPTGAARSGWGLLNNNTLWMRHAFQLDEPWTIYSQLRVYNLQPATIYLNGQLVATLPERADRFAKAYHYVDIPHTVRAGLGAGQHVLAIYTERQSILDDAFIDAGIWNPKLPEDSNGYNLRAAKLSDRVIFFVNGQELVTINEDWGPSCVGLMTRNMSARFDGITAYELGWDGPLAISVAELTTGDTTPVLTGALGDNVGVARVVVSVGGNSYVASVNGSTWLVEVTAPLAYQTYSVSAVLYDTVGGFISDTTANELTILEQGVTVDIGLPEPATTTTGPVTFTVTYGNADTISLAAEHVSLNTQDSISAQVTISGTGAQRIVTLSDITGDGTVGIVLAPGTASNVHGGASAALSPVPLVVASAPDSKPLPLGPWVLAAALGLSGLALLARRAYRLP